MMEKTKPELEKDLISATKIDALKEKRIKELEAMLKEKTEKTVKSTTESLNLHERLIIAEKVVKEQATAIQVLEVKLEKAETESDGLGNECDKLIDENTRLKEEINEFKASIHEINSLSDKQADRILDLESTNVELEKQVSDYEQMLDKAKIELSDLNKAMGE